jgi:TonB-dependent receptor
VNNTRKTAIAIGVAQLALMASGAALAQTDTATVVVHGQRAALESAQNIKKNADEIVDSIVADDIGKLPDKSVTEVLQRIVGVSIDRTMNRVDPQQGVGDSVNHYAAEGTGVSIRGLGAGQVRSEFNGRDAFSANGGRALSFEDVPPELMAGVDVYKNPSAEQIEGAVSGLVNLRTAMPFDYKGFKLGLSAQAGYSSLREKTTPSGSLMLSNRWDTDAGQFGALFDVAYSESATRTDAFQVEPYYPRDDVVAGQTVWIPKGSQYRTLEFDRKRSGLYGALQWKKNDLESSLTYFKSKYRMNWNENALFAQSSPYNITVDDGATYSPTGALLTGTLRDDVDKGINFGADTRFQNRISGTQDISWNLAWKPNDKWSFKADLQYIRSDTHSLDSTVATGIQMPSETIDLTGGRPTLVFSDADRAYLADPANYYWAFTMEHKDRSVANEKAIKLDGRFNFDGPVLSDLRFGVRFTDRDAVTTTTVPGYNWSPISQPWQIGWDINHLAYLGDPRFSGNTHLHNFNNFFNGNASVPPLIFPDASTAAGYPDSYAQLHTYHDILCTEQHNGDSSACPAWQPASFGTDPSGTNDQHERTQAAYGQLRFAFDDLAFPVDGNVGARIVHTDSQANGYAVFSTTAPNIPDGASVTGVAIPDIAPFAQAENFSHSYTNVLPSLNLRMKAGKAWQFRFAAAQGISRPDFTQLQAYTSMSQTATTHTVTNPDGSTTVVVDAVSDTGTASGNPLLKPVKANNLDLTAEWYFNKTGSLTFAVFDKELKDIIINQTYIRQLPDTSGGLHDFTVTGPVNGAKGYARGLEVAFQQYFDKLPGWMAGFGVQANYTYVDSHQSLYNPLLQPYCSGNSGGAANLNLNLNGCDTNGQTFGNLPLQNLSRNAYNLALLYDRGPLSARMSWSWRSRYLQAVNVNGTQGTDGTDTNPNSATQGQHNVAWGLPTWADGYGQLDAGIFYKIDDHLTIGVEANNLTDSTYKQLMQQHIGMQGRAWFSTGPSYALKMSYDL